jgi:hypothetical protein
MKAEQKSRQFRSPDRLRLLLFRPIFSYERRERYGVRWMPIIQPSAAQKYLKHELRPLSKASTSNSCPTPPEAKSPHFSRTFAVYLVSVYVDLHDA